MHLLLALLFLAVPALAQDEVPDRQIPPTVVTEVRQLQTRFDNALSQDCDPSRCYSKGCRYVDHEIADRPRAASLPGLGGDPAPSVAEAQAFLTRAECAFAHETTVPQRAVDALALRLQDKLSTGWTQVAVTHAKLRPIPAYLAEPYEPPVPEDEETDDTDVPPPAEPEPEPEPPYTLATASFDLWMTLLPHLFWMIALVLGTIAGILLIWAVRRVGQRSIEDEMLLAEIARGGPPPSEGPVEVEAHEDEDAAFVEEQDRVWRERLEGAEAGEVDPEIRALLRDLLRHRELDLLAAAMLRFPSSLPGAMPSGAVGGELAAAKLELAEHLRSVDQDALPDDVTFFRQLNRHALSATVTAQQDAHLVRTLREDFGAAGLGSLIEQLPARPAALLFALAPVGIQDELVRLLEPARLASMAEMLLRSNRMSPVESTHLAEVLDAARDDEPPPMPPVGDVSDRGETFDAAAPLSRLLEGVHPDRRAKLFDDALARSHGSLPDWTRGILVADMLLALDTETRADLFLGIESEPLAAWLSLRDPEVRQRVLTGMPSALLGSLQASMRFASRARQLELAEQGRQALSRGLGGALARVGKDFTDAVRHGGG